MNRLLGGNPLTGYSFSRSSSEPALLVAWHKFGFLAFSGAGLAFAGYGRFVRGYNNLWLLAAGLPVMTWSMVMKSRQPVTLIDNAYRYLIAKRAATAEFEANQGKLMANEWAKTQEYSALQGGLHGSCMTLYDLESHLVQQIESGKIQ